MGRDSVIKQTVRARYAAAAKRAGARAGNAEGGCGCGAGDAFGAGNYTGDIAAELPREAVAASLGCGNPTALAELRPGDVVLDLGSGGGIDVLLAAKRVGPGGKAYGLDMTDEMLALARQNQQRASVDNAEFLRGEMEAIPLPDASVDAVISNCVINLAADKDVVLREAFRVLKPAGRFAVADVVVRDPLPSAARRDLELWAGCVAGALDEADYRAKLAAAGFTEISVEPLREHRLEGLGTIVSAFVRARKR